MHISEGVLAPHILAGTGVLTLAGTAIGLKKLDYDRIMPAAMLSASFFAASLIHIPVGPTSAHLILNGLLGVLLGWAAFPAILVGLVLQALLFQFGGITTLGANTLNMALPPVLCFYLFRNQLLRTTDNENAQTPLTVKTGAAFACGFLAVALSALMTAGTLALSGETFTEAAYALLLSSFPIMCIEGVITAGIIGFIAKVRPEILLSNTPATGTVH